MCMILYAFLIGAFAAVYRNILAYEPILNWWFAIGRRWETKFWHKPIWGCEKCIAGQVCLWTYILNTVGKYPRFSGIIGRLVPDLGVITPNLLGGILFVSTGILSAFLISYLIDHIKNN